MSEPLPRSDSDLDAAKALFWAHDGSTFHMSRGDVGALERFRRFGVSPDVQADWLRELTAEKLVKLSELGNMMVVSFLLHHGDTAYMSELVAQAPLGTVRERCAYLEDLLRYIDRCAGREFFVPRHPRTHYTSADVRRALEVVHQRTRQSFPRPLSTANARRVRDIAESAETRLNASGAR